LRGAWELTRGPPSITGISRACDFCRLVEGGAGGGGGRGGVPGRGAVGPVSLPPRGRTKARHRWEAQPTPEPGEKRRRPAWFSQAPYRGTDRNPAGHGIVQPHLRRMNDGIDLRKPW